MTPRPVIPRRPTSKATDRARTLPQAPRPVLSHACNVNDRGERFRSLDPRPPPSTAEARPLRSACTSLSAASRLRRVSPPPEHDERPQRRRSALVELGRVLSDALPYDRVCTSTRATPRHEVKSELHRSLLHILRNTARIDVGFARRRFAIFEHRSCPLHRFAFFVVTTAHQTLDCEQARRRFTAPRLQVSLPRRESAPRHSAQASEVIRGAIEKAARQVADRTSGGVHSNCVTLTSTSYDFVRVR